MKPSNQLNAFTPSMELNSIVVVGAGTMGSGIAQWFAQQRCAVELVDNSEKQLTLALSNIHASWDKLAEKKKLSSSGVEQMKQLLKIKHLDSVGKKADLVIEAIIENLEVKKELFKK